MNRLGEFMSSTKRKIEHFHAIVAQQRQKIYVKKCAAVYCRSRCRRSSRCSNPVTTARQEGNTQSIGLWRNTLFKNWTENWVSEFFTFIFSTSLHFFNNILCAGLVFAVTHSKDVLRVPCQDHSAELTLCLTSSIMCNTCYRSTLNTSCTCVMPKRS